MPKVYRNTLVLCVTWSVSSYSFYFCEFYLRLIPTNSIYLQKMLMGFSDIFATLVYAVLVRKVGMKESFVILFSVLIAGALGLTILIGCFDTE